MSTVRVGAIAAAAIASLVTANTAGAANIAIFGNNNIASFYGGLAGNTVSIVSDAQLSTSGFLDS
ncbi:MAG: hypothetical protein KA781_04435, partial [Aquabacterium sp.]|nr:hypothetical protein [Aquabacterium sp.]